MRIPVPQKAEQRENADQSEYSHAVGVAVGGAVGTGVAVGDAANPT